METNPFYPDFIIWIKKRDKQDIVFVDPKGILHLAKEKVRFCKDIIKEIEKSLQEKLKKQKDKTELNLFAYIISVTPYAKARAYDGEGRLRKEEFKEDKIHFQEKNLEYLKVIFEGKLSNYK